MVFGWGKKEQVVEEQREKSVISTHKDITLEDIPSIIQDITDLRQETLIVEVKSFQKRIESDSKILLSIADELRKDNLKADDMDPHLTILVNRGKKEVISSIQSEFRIEFSNIDSFDKVIDFQRNASRGIKKVGDILGKHSRVIHIFAKKYAKKLKDDLEVLTDNLTEINTLISNYNSNQELLDDIKNSLNDFADIKKDISNHKTRKLQLDRSIGSEQQNETNLKKYIDEMKSSSEYKEFQVIQQSIISVSDEEKSAKKKIEEQFIKISRPLNKYVYVSALDKPLKIMTENLATSPYDVLSRTNMSDITTILNSVRSGVESGSVSVKDVNKSKHAINEIMDLLPQLIDQKNMFVEKKSKLISDLTIFDNDKLSKSISGLEKSTSSISDATSKMSLIQEQIDSSKSSLHGIISKLELNLKQASSIHYKISYTKNDIQI
jgi:hypothetical protein